MRVCSPTAAATFTLVSPLADGTDQMAAQAALGRGWRLQAVLPFDRAAYFGDFPDLAQRERFEALLGKAECVLELPGDPDDRLDAYVMAGRATVAHCDLLIAVWDGLPPRGRGGTGEIVELAVARGTPIIHLPVDPGQPAMILWAAFDPNVLTRTGGTRGRREHSRRRNWSDSCPRCSRRRPTRASEGSTTGSSPNGRAASGGGSNIRCCWRSPGLPASTAATLARIAMRGGDRGGMA